MPSITFRPPLGGDVSRVEIDKFTLGLMQGKGADGRGYPGAMRALYVQKARSGIAYFGKLAPVEKILAAKAGRTKFASIIVDEPGRRVTMTGVTFGHFYQYINEPKKLELHALTLTVSGR